MGRKAPTFQRIHVQIGDAQKYTVSYYGSICYTGARARLPDPADKEEQIMNSSTKLSGLAKMLAALTAGIFLMLPAAKAGAPTSWKPFNGASDIHVVPTPQKNDLAQNDLAQKVSPQVRKQLQDQEALCSRLEWRVLRQERLHLQPSQDVAALNRDSDRAQAGESGEVVSAVYRRGFAQPQLHPCAPSADSRKQRLLVLLMLWKSMA